jgi:glutamyl-tRNA(Gln) amidotransferase subunit E
VSNGFAEQIRNMESDNKYSELGFKCGLEIHQQLLTSKKLFCRCPAGYRNDDPDGEIIRHMRPTLSELGEYDGTALMEFKTKKNVVYQLYRENCCTYEMDDTPPFPINREALEIALKLAMLLNCAIVDELHVSRKQYLDGSIPTGFQRTAIVGVGGWIPYKGRKINITHVCLEEDACREVTDIGHEIVFRTDRLSMPLLEVITGPEMLTPREAMEVDAIIGRILKASGLVRRGIGSVRQDVNVSVKGGERVEIKGVPQTWMIEKLTAIEADRQASLLGIREMLRLRGITDKTIHGEKFDLTRYFRESGIPAIAAALDNGGVIKGIKIDGFAGILSMPTQPGLKFANELAGRLKVIACLDKYPNLAVSDIPSMAGFMPEIWQRLKKACECKHTDALVVTWGSAADVATALAEIKIRVIEATRGVPNETRQAMKDYTTDFERILPGPDRMYPDTDSPPVELSAAYLARLKSELPEPAYAVEERWVEKGASREIAEKAVVSAYAKLFDSILGKLTLPPDLIWGAILKLKVPDTQGVEVYNGNILEIFKSFKAGHISRDSLHEIIAELGLDGQLPISELIKQKKILDCHDQSVKKLVREFVAETSDGHFMRQDDRANYICGQIKSKLGNRIDGLTLRREIDKMMAKEE